MPRRNRTPAQLAKTRMERARARERGKVAKPIVVIDPRFIHAAIARVEASLVSDVLSYASCIGPAHDILVREFGADSDLVEGHAAAAEYLEEIEYRQAEIAGLFELLEAEK